MDFVSKETVQRRRKRGRTEVLAMDSVRVGERLREVGDVSALADSMKKIGLESPISVRTVREGEGGYYQVVAGARRLAAAKALGWTGIECQVHVNMSDDEALALEIVENLHRLDLTAAERRAQVKMLAKTFERMEDKTAHNAPFSGGEVGKGKAGPGRGKKGVASKVAEATGLSKSQVNRLLAEEQPKAAKPSKAKAKAKGKAKDEAPKGKGLDEVLGHPEPHGNLLPGHTSSKKASAPEDLPSDGTCSRCGAAPRNADGLCNSCVDEEHSEEGTEGPTVVKFKEAAHKVRIAAPPKAKTVDPVEDVVADMLAFARSRGLDVKAPVSPELAFLHAAHWFFDKQRREKKEAAR